MPQVAVQQPTNLMEMFSSASPMMWDIARGQVNDQTLGNALNRAQAQQSMQFESQKQPFELAQLGLQNETARAQLPGVTANSNMLMDKAEISRNTLPQQQQSAISDLAKKVSDNDLAMAESEVHRALLSGDPQVRKQAETAWQHLNAVKMEKMKLDSQASSAANVARINAASQASLEDKRIAAGKYLKAGTMNAKLRLDSLTKPSEIDAVLRQILSDENLPEQERAKYMARFVANTKALNTENAVRTASNAGKLNTPGMLDMPGIEQPQAAPAPQPTASAPALKSNYTQGQTYQSKSGKYLFKGGNPNDRANWEKVE